MLRETLQKQNIPSVSFNLDIEEDNAHFETQQKFLQKIKLELGSASGYVFIDEIQRKKNAGIFLKGIYDMKLPYHLVVSGSGSIELKEQIYESLAGRKRMFELFPLSFEEFVHYKTKYQYKDRLPIFFQTEPRLGQQWLEEYLHFGGYPRVVLAETMLEKISSIRDIYQSYIEKDIALLLRVERMDVFSQLVKILAHQSGKLLNISELSRTLGASIPTINEYIWYLEKTFIIHRVSPFHRNVRKEMKKSPIIYSTDLGLQNFAAGVFGKEVPQERYGWLFQNAVYNAIYVTQQLTGASVHFWRTTDGAEVDIVIDQGDDIIPVEVKYTVLKKRRLPRSFVQFIKKYSPKKAYIVNISLQEETTVGGTTVSIVPFWHFLISLF